MICINGYEFWDMKISIIMALLIVLEINTHNCITCMFHSLLHAYKSSIDEILTNKSLLLQLHGDEHGRI
jgi:hypothetical protein